MNCWHCKTELIWDSDVDRDDDLYYIMVTFLHCPKYGSDVEVWLPNIEENTSE
jgi:hypothetical protein